MFQKITTKQSNQFLLISGIIMLAFNLRPAITAVGPLVTTIQQELHINNLEAGLITTIPLIAFAVLSPLVARFSRLWGNEKTLFIALLILTIGIFIRYTANIWVLYTGTLIIGSGIAIMNVLLPSVIKSDFPHKIGVMTSIYTTAMCAMAGLASGLSIPLAEGAGFGWEKTLASWGFLSIIGLLLWSPQLRANKKNKIDIPSPEAKQSIWNSRTAWYISIFMGLQSFIFYCIVAWLPAILIGKEMNEHMAGWMLLYVQIVGLPATFSAPIIAGKQKKMWTTIATIAAMNLIGFAGLNLFHQTGWIITSITILGLSSGGSISLAYMIITTKANDHQQAAELSGMAQAVGYLLAALGPVLLGFTYDQTSNWLYPILIIQLANVLLLISGVKSVLKKAII